MKCFPIYKVLFVVLCLGMTGNVWGATYYQARAKASAALASGEGKVYLSTENNKDNAKSSTTTTEQLTAGSENKTVGQEYTFYLWVDVKYGYECLTSSHVSAGGYNGGNGHTANATLSPTDAGSRRWDVTLAAYGKTESHGMYELKSTYNDYTITANITRRPIELTLATFVPNTEETPITWSNTAYTGTWMVHNNYILSADEWNTPTAANSTFAGLNVAEVGTTADDADGDNYGSGAAATDGEGECTWDMTYTLPIDDEAAMATIKQGWNDVQATFQATTGNSLTATGKVYVDLTPTFTIPTIVIQGELGVNTKEEFTIKIVEDAALNATILSYFDWTIGERTDDVSELGIIQKSDGTFTTSFTPWENKIYEISVPITATLKSDPTVTHTAICTVVGICGVDGTIEIVQGETDYTNGTYTADIGNNSSFAQTFTVKTLAVKDLTITPPSASSHVLQYTTTQVSESEIRLDVFGTFSQAQAANLQLTVSGLSAMDNTTSISSTLTLDVKRSYVDVNLNATVNAENIVLAWTANPFDPTYKLYRDGELVTTLSGASVEGYTDNTNGKKSHTYTLETIVEGKTYTSTISTTPFGMTADLPATRDDEGNALFDELYIVSETNCDIYDVQDDLTYAKRSGTYNPTTWRPGRIDGTGNSMFTKADGTPDNKRIYITGTCENLFWNGDTKIYENGAYKNYTDDHNMGWMQPVNCHVYLDNVRLQAASIVDWEATDIYKEPYGSPTLTETSDYIWKAAVSNSASIFYLPEGLGRTMNTSTIHLRGNNYLGGGLAKSSQFVLQYPPGPSGTTLGNVRCKVPNYSAAIAIKDASFLDERPFEKTKSTDADIVATKDALRADVYNIPNLPDITCKFDAVWADGKIVDGYLDVSTRPSVNGDINDKAINSNDATITEWDDRMVVTHWSNYYGYRHAAPLVTGGTHGKFVINGGRMNLWPANSKTFDFYHKLERFLANVVCKGGHTANYLVCGGAAMAITMNKDYFSQSSSSVISAFGNIQPAPMVIMYGAGQGYPVGSLEINGGTITTNTDPNSFAVQYVNASGAPQKNIDQDGSNQPLLGPANLTITGGTFQTPIYATTKHGVGNGTESTKWTDVVTDADKKTGVNKATTPQTLSLVDIPMSAANTDYSKYAVDIRESSALTPNNNEVGYIVHAGTADEYQYGMANVWSDKNAAQCHFYLPASKGAFYRNYHVQNGETLTAFDLPAYNITVDAGGEMTPQDVFVPGRIAYRPAIEEEKYQTIAMPFTVEKMYASEPEGDFYFTGYVEDRDATDATDNSAAYAYIYHMDDGVGNPYALAADETFKNYYHTHPNGLMQKGKTYVLKFPDFGGYFEDNPVTFLGAKRQTINASSDFAGIDAMRPTANNTFALVGNATFTMQDITGESVYLLNQDDNYFYSVNNQTSLAPLQGVVLANEVTQRRVRVLGRTLVMTSLDNTIWSATVIGGDDKITVIPSAGVESIQVYTADGQLVGLYDAAENTPMVIPAAAGVYVVRVGDGVTKVMVW